MFNDFEKNLGLKLKPLIEYEDEKELGANDPVLDLKVFEKVFKNTYQNIKQKHNEVVNKLRENEFPVYEKIRDS